MFHLLSLDGDCEKSYASTGVPSTNMLRKQQQACPASTQPNARATTFFDLQPQRNRFRPLKPSCRALRPQRTVPRVQPLRPRGMAVVEFLRWTDHAWLAGDNYGGTMDSRPQHEPPFSTAHQSIMLGWSVALFVYTHPACQKKQRLKRWPIFPPCTLRFRTARCTIKLAQFADDPSEICSRARPSGRDLKFAVSSIHFEPHPPSKYRNPVFASMRGQCLLFPQSAGDRAHRVGIQSL